MSPHKPIEITKLKPGAMIWTTNHTQRQRACRSLVGAEDFRALDFFLAVQTNQAFPNRGSGFGRGNHRDLGTCAENRANNFSIARAAAEHTTDRVHDLVFTGSVIFV